MEYRQLGRTDMKVSAISFGAWAIGGTWGPVDDEESMRALHAAVDAGTNFVDTADVYGDGRSERLVARLRRERKGETIFVATKAGRRLPKQTPEGYSRENLTAWVERSLEEPRDGGGRSPPAPLPAPGRLRPAGGLRHPRRPREGGEGPPLRRERRDGGRGAPRRCATRSVKTVQIIFNMLRLKPAEELFAQALEPARRHPRPRAPRERAADRQADEGLDLRQRRPPQLQPRRRGLRQGRDLLGRALRRRARGRREAAPARAPGGDDEPARAPVDADVRGGELRDPGGEDAAAGPRQRRRRRPAAALAGHDGGGRRPSTTSGSAPLVHASW